MKKKRGPAMAQTQFTTSLFTQRTPPICRDGAPQCSVRSVIFPHTLHRYLAWIAAPTTLSASEPAKPDNTIITNDRMGELPSIQ